MRKNSSWHRASVAVVVLAAAWSAAAQAAPRATVSITCARNTPSGIELFFDIPDSVTVTDLVLQRDAEPRGVPAVEPLAAALAVLAAVALLGRRRGTGLAAAGAGIAAAGLAHAATLIPLSV